MARCNLGLLGRKSEMTRTPPTEPATSREQNAGFFSKLTFAWLNPLMKVSTVRLEIGGEVAQHFADRLQTTLGSE